MIIASRTMTRSERSKRPWVYARGRQVNDIGVLRIKIIKLWGPLKTIFFKSLYFKNSSMKMNIIIWLLQLIYIKNYNIRSMKIKVDRVQSIAFHDPDPDRGQPVADLWSTSIDVRYAIVTRWTFFSSERDDYRVFFFWTISRFFGDFVR
jgi:hypothetical protein